MDTPKIITNSLGTEVPILSPFQEGFRAYFSGLPKDNPYPIDNPNRADWLSGYLEAKIECEGNIAD